MPTSTPERLLCKYHYDPLDRLVNSTPFEQLTQRYYCRTRLATELQDSVQCTILQHDERLLAQQLRENGKVVTTLLTTDLQRSVLNVLAANQINSLAYTPYGHRPHENGLLSLLGFNGERPDTVTGHFFLGNYRHFNPALMRFNSPDSWSPFGEGGLNAYAYCDGDPANKNDPTGHMGNIFKAILNSLGRTPSNRSKALQMIRKQKKEVKTIITNHNRLKIISSERQIYANYPTSDYLDMAIDGQIRMKTIETERPSLLFAQEKFKELSRKIAKREKNLNIQDVKEEINSIRKKAAEMRRTA